MTEQSFEQAFIRLEEILAKMNDDKVSLDDSLKLFEEADNLISQCNKKLNFTQQKIQTLIKNRSDVVIENEKPQMQDFTIQPKNVLN